MCGRFGLLASPEEVRALFGYVDQPNFPPRYNIAPTQPVAVVRLENGERRFALVRWGLIPSWVKDPRDFSLLFNARSETVAEKASFRNAIRRRRCLVPASGFYEWQRVSKTEKRAYWVPPAAGGVIAFAGIWESWMGRDGEEIETMAILTAASSPEMAEIHPRTPVVIPPEDFDRWLDCSSDDIRPIADLLKAPDDGFFAPVRVSDRVNSVANDDAGNLTPFQEPETAAVSPQSTKDQLDLL